MTPRLSLRGITKRYPGITANDRISLDAMPGEVLAVLGENGAGKSTLMRIIYGATRPDEGEIEFDGMPFDVDSPAQARARGVAMVHQHFALFDTLTAAENVLLGQTKPMTVAEVSSEIERLGRQYGLEVDPSAVVMELSMGERQRIEIIRALMTNPKLLILDEPTSVLTPQAVAKLFKTLHQLAAEGVTILFISHKLDEIRAARRKESGPVRLDIQRSKDDRFIALQVMQFVPYAYENVSGLHCFQDEQATKVASSIGNPAK